MKRFPWGKIIERHEIGPYEIIEYDAYGTGNSSHKVTGEILFHVEDAASSYVSLDDAIVGAIVYRKLGANCHLIAHHFMSGLAKMSEGNK